jgi:hypothetical protein
MATKHPTLAGADILFGRGGSASSEALPEPQCAALRWYAADDYDKCVHRRGHPGPHVGARVGEWDTRTEKITVYFTREELAAIDAACLELRERAGKIDRGRLLRACFLLAMEDQQAVEVALMRGDGA